MMIAKHFIFAYGSLINSTSRRVTGTAGISIPVRVQGLKRYWVSFAGTNMRAVGVRPDTDSDCNGVLFEVPQEELEKFDMRERGYERHALSHEQVSYRLPEQNKLSDDNTIWVYIYPEDPHKAQFNPISQAYLDVILLGCLEVDESYAREFLETTYLWQDWHNDRLQPRYPRAINHHQELRLDALLASCCGEFTARYK